jgi:hypothetical protein
VSVPVPDGFAIELAHGARRHADVVLLEPDGVAVLTR